jgi:hypothetical protein
LTITRINVPGKPLNDGLVLSGITSECHLERIDWPFDHPNLKGEILGSTNGDSRDGTPAGLENLELMSATKTI